MAPQDFELGHSLVLYGQLLAIIGTALLLSVLVHSFAGVLFSLAIGILVAAIGFAALGDHYLSGTDDNEGDPDTERRIIQR